jgi:hypothetical protein
MRKEIESKFQKEIPLIFNLRSDADSDMEIKFIDDDGSVFGKKFSLKDSYKDWENICIYLANLEYWWGGDSKFNNLKAIEIAFSGQGTGKVMISEIKFGKAGMKSSFELAGPKIDQDRELKGFGFKQRRDKNLIPEDPLVLEYLKILQDNSSKEKMLLPSMEDLQCQTFNNALVAMVFILKDERERAERILNFYANATDPNNEDKLLQNFFYNGEARGFYQHVLLRDTQYQKAYHSPGGVDRWMGDMAWLLIAYKFYEKKYNSQKYQNIINLLKNLLISFFKDNGDGTRYVQHGFRNDDRKLHEDYGHHEGNIDCYAAFKICGEDLLAEKIKNWLDKELNEKENLPLDLYSWRVLAFGKDYQHLLNIVEYDFRFRKIITHNGKLVM